MKKAGELSQEELIPRQFIYKILKKLEHRGWVEIRSGNGGGCRLSTSLEGLSLLDLIHAMGDQIIANQCTLPGHICPWSQKKGAACQCHFHLMELQQKLEEMLSALSLHQLCAKNEVSLECQKGGYNS